MSSQHFSQALSELACVRCEEYDFGDVAESSLPEEWYSIVLIQKFWRNVLFLRNVKKRLLQDDDSLKTISATISSIKILDSKEAKSALNDKELQSSVRSLLCALPNTSKYALGHLYGKLGKDKITYSMNMMINAILFAIHPEHLKAATSEGFESILCGVASRLLSMCIYDFCRHAVEPGTPLHIFHHKLLWYRFCMRFFFESMDRLKTLERNRMVQELCENYSQLQHAFQQTIRLPEDSQDKASFLETTTERFSMIKSMLSKLTGVGRAESMLREIGGSVAEIYSLPSDPNMANLSPPESPKLSMARFEEEPMAVPQESQLEVLESRLSAIAAGGDSERLVHEICLDPNYRLPDTPATAFISLLVEQGFEVSVDGICRICNPGVLGMNQSVPESVKRLVLEIMADRMVCALRPSGVDDIALLSVGQRVPVAVPEEFPLRVFMSATIQSICAESNPVDMVFVCSKKRHEKVPFALIKQRQEPIDSSLFTAALEDLNARISSFSKPASGDSNLLDFELLHQMLHHSSISAREMAALLSSTVNARLDALIAPVRASRLQAWTEMFRSSCAGVDLWDSFLPLLPFFFEVSSAFVDELQRDMANYYISVIAPSLFKHGHELLMRKFRNRIDEVNEVLLALNGALTTEVDSRFSTFLPVTVTWVTAVSDGMVAAHGSQLLLLAAATGVESVLPLCASSGITADFILTFSALLFVDLLKVPMRLTSTAAQLPEIYSWDGDRLAVIRDDVDSIVLLACIGASVKQVCSRLGLRLSEDSKDAEESLFYRLDTLLRQPEVQLMDSIAAEACRFVECLVQSKTRRDLSTGMNCVSDGTWKQTLRSALESNTAEASPIMQLFSKRTYELLLRGLLLGAIQKERFMRYSFSTRQQAAAINGVVGKAKTLLTHHQKVHQSTYETLLRIEFLRRWGQVSSS